MRVMLTLLFSVAFSRNHRLYVLLLAMTQYRVGIVGSVCQQILCINTINQLASLLAICCGTFCNKYSDRHTMRIHGQV